MEQSLYDVLVVGGGAAGLSAAVALGRARRSVLVVDAGQPRNAPAEQVHNVLGREGSTPAALLADGRADVAAYGGQVVAGTVAAVEREGEVFAARLGDGGRVRARRVLLATGLVDELPDVPGLAARWGHDVLHCPYCHGWEARDAAVGVLATGPFAVSQALLWRQWSADVVLLAHTGPVPTAEQAEQLAAHGVPVVPGEVVGLAVEGDRLTGVRLASGALVPCTALVVAPLFRARTDLLGGLGLVAQDQELAGAVVGSALATDAAGATVAPGVYAAGNAADVRAQVVSAAAAGLQTAAAVNADLIAEETAAAVVALRARAA